MKYLFIVFALILLIASGVTALMMPEQQSGRPIIYWVTDANPARIEQIRLFEQWMVRNGHTDDHGRCAVELRLDTANNDSSKKIIQSVSGVAGDVMDMYSGAEVRFFQSMGVLADLTDDARRLGFDPSHTYPAAVDELVIDDRQYAAACNVSAPAYWVNNAVFKDAGVAPPAWRWTLDDFERIGRELCDKANAGRSRREIFLSNQFDFAASLRSLGLDRFNETMTRCTLNDRRYVDLLERVRRWTYVDRILPRPEDIEGLGSQQAGYGGNAFQLFNRGNYAMIHSGRYALIQFRSFNETRRLRGMPPMDLSVVEPPHGGFPNASIVSRAATVFRGSRHPQYARLFLSFLTSEDYNMQIVEDADSLPPDPAYARTEAFTHPSQYREEWNAHEPWSRIARTIAIPSSHSPFIIDRVAGRIQIDLLNAYMAGRASAEQTAAQTASQINAEIESQLAENPSLRALYDRKRENQKRIDELRARNEVIALELIDNPFHRRYYAEKGWAR